MHWPISMADLACSVTRLAALGEQLDAPLLVTNLTNVFYLTGFDSSNAALLVEPGGGATLYTDFRYAESARDVPDVEVQMTKRALMADVGGRHPRDQGRRGGREDRQGGESRRPRLRGAHRGDVRRTQRARDRLAPA